MADPRPVTPLGLLAALLDRIDERLDGADDALRADLDQARALAAGLDPYLSACSTPESPALARIARRTATQDWGGRTSDTLLEQEMLSGHLEGQTLKFLVAVTGARRVLELGMFTGYSALAMAEGLPADGVVVACELEADVAALASQSFRESPAGEKIQVRVGPADVTLGELAADGAVFDLVFIDADKGGYLGYLQAVLEGGLLSPGGMVCVDNTLMQGQPYGAGAMTDNGAAIAGFNQAVAEDQRLEQVVLPLRDGLTLIRRVSS